ncbi:hypothetical protein [Georgenia sp. SUBG003]|uniref:hypothetical protein n=1 Tax=Georgenia sp. SUBG003 TaxID=1497974 RepID=UPI0004D36CE8|nr:hypothetical protein DA06_05845 [Georgenia sp. SUBG003]
MADAAAVRVPYEVRVGTALGPILCAAVPHVRSATTATRVTLVLEAASLEAVVDVLRSILVPGVALELLRVVVDPAGPATGRLPARRVGR